MVTYHNRTRTVNSRVSVSNKKILYFEYQLKIECFLIYNSTHILSKDLHDVVWEDKYTDNVTPNHLGE